PGPVIHAHAPARAPARAPHALAAPLRAIASEPAPEALPDAPTPEPRRWRPDQVRGLALRLHPSPGQSHGFLLSPRSPATTTGHHSREARPEPDPSIRHAERMNAVAQNLQSNSSPEIRRQ